MTRGPVSLEVAVSYATPRKGVPAAMSFRRWVAAALDTRAAKAYFDDPYGDWSIADVWHAEAREIDAPLVGGAAHGADDARHFGRLPRRVIDPPAL